FSPQSDDSVLPRVTPPLKLSNATNPSNPSLISSSELVRDAVFIAVGPVVADRVLQDFRLPQKRGRVDHEQRSSFADVEQLCVARVGNRCSHRMVNPGDRERVLAPQDRVERLVGKVVLLEVRTTTGQNEGVLYSDRLVVAESQPRESEA